MLSPPTRLASLDVVSCTDCSSGGTPVLLSFCQPSLLLQSLPWPRGRPPGSCPRKGGAGGATEQDMESSRGAAGGGRLPGLVLERKKGSRAASPAALLVCPGQGREGGGGGGRCAGQSHALPQRQEHKQRRLRIRKSEDGKFQGLPAPPAPERVWAERRQR